MRDRRLCVSVAVALLTLTGCAGIPRYTSDGRFLHLVGSTMSTFECCRPPRSQDCHPPASYVAFFAPSSTPTATTTSRGAT